MVCLSTVVVIHLSDCSERTDRFQILIIYPVHVISEIREDDPNLSTMRANKVHVNENLTKSKNIPDS